MAKEKKKKTRKGVVVVVNKGGPHAIGKVILAADYNEISSEDWENIKELPSIKKKIDAGVLEVTGEQSEPVEEEEKPKDAGELLDKLDGK